MHVTTRRQFLQSIPVAVAAGSALFAGRAASATPFGLPIGLQLYSVRELLPHDFDGTLNQVAALGYTEVEAAGYFGRSAAEVARSFRAAGLRCPSAHYSYFDLAAGFDKLLAFNHEVGVETIICSFPGFKNPERLKDRTMRTVLTSFTVDDWLWNAEQFNAMGAKAKAAGMRFGYHNHTMEFHADGGMMPFDALVEHTDPGLVTFELDCGWVMVGGGDPVAYLERYANRISMLHVKDFKKTAKPGSILEPPPAAELGTGSIDYHPIFAAARKAHLTHIFVEQEAFNLPPMQSLKMDIDYLKAFPA